MNKLQKILIASQIADDYGDYQKSDKIIVAGIGSWLKRKMRSIGDVFSDSVKDVVDAFWTEPIEEGIAQTHHASDVARETLRGKLLPIGAEALEKLDDAMYAQGINPVRLTIGEKGFERIDVPDENPNSRVKKEYGLRVSLEKGGMLIYPRVIVDAAGRDYTASFGIPIQQALPKTYQRYKSQIEYRVNEAFPPEDPFDRGLHRAFPPGNAEKGLSRAEPTAGDPNKGLSRGEDPTEK